MPELLDSRRLTGPNLISDGPGAVIDVTVAAEQVDDAIAAWRRHAAAIAEAVGWKPELHERRFRGGASLVLGAPIDALYAATELNEWAWSATEATLRGEPAPEVAAAVGELRKAISAERNPALLALRDAALQHGVGFLTDDDFASVGYGAGSQTWPVNELPAPQDVDWGAVHDVPIVMVTGTNGKSTTTRLVAAIAQAAGRTPGVTSTDGLWVGADRIEAGDYSGPGGARTVLRDRRCELAVLETARGGILRRGLSVVRADAAAVLNVADDHMGEYGVETLSDLVEAKFTIRKAVDPDRPLVLNVEDAPSVTHGLPLVRSPITWFSQDPTHQTVADHIARGGAACVQDGDWLSFARAGEVTPLVRVQDVPLTFGGRAGFNIQNALAAIGLAVAIDLPIAAIGEGLRSFESDPQTNPGRGNVFHLGEITAIVDFAHNSHGLTALMAMANALPATRRLVTLGQAGDRTDEQIREMVRVVHAARPDRIILKEMTKYLRGRQPGVIPEIMAAELRALGAPADSWEITGSELEAVHHALDWARPGDLLLFSIQAQRGEVIDLLRSRAG